MEQPPPQGGRTVPLRGQNHDPTPPPQRHLPLRKPSMDGTQRRRSQKRLTKMKRLHGCMLVAGMIMGSLLSQLIDSFLFGSSREFNAMLQQVTHLSPHQQSDPPATTAITSVQAPIIPSPPRQTTETNEQQQQSPPSTRLVVDIVSTGSNQRRDMLAAQQALLTQHASVRHFVSVTEDDDWDPACHTLTRPDVNHISETCRSKSGSGTTWNLIRNEFASHFAQSSWLDKSPYPVGWVCSQTRPLIGISKLMARYETAETSTTSNEPSSSSLPDYMIVVDDDSYVNMSLVEQNVYLDDTSTVVGAPNVTVGCAIRWPTHDVNFTFPWGGFGVFYNKASISKLLEPIHCPSSEREETAAEKATQSNPEACAQLDRNYLDEKQHFQNGMSVLQLMENYVRQRPFSQYPTWSTKKDVQTRGFCMHSDWLQGYFVNFYNLSDHNHYDMFADVPQDRLFAYQNSHKYKREKGQCKNDLKVTGKCFDNSLVCHHVTTEFLRGLANQTIVLPPWKLKAKGIFKPKPPKG